MIAPPEMLILIAMKFGLEISSLQITKVCKFEKIALIAWI